MLDSTNRSDGTRSRRIGMRLVLLLLLLPFDVLMMNLARRGDQSVDGRYFCGPGRRSSCSQNKYKTIDRSIPSYKPIKAFYLWAESNCWNNSKRRPSRGCAELRLWSAGKGASKATGSKRPNSTNSKWSQSPTTERPFKNKILWPLLDWTIVKNGCLQSSPFDYEYQLSSKKDLRRSPDMPRWFVWWSTEWNWW